MYELQSEFGRRRVQFRVFTTRPLITFFESFIFFFFSFACAAAKITRRHRVGYNFEKEKNQNVPVQVGDVKPYVLIRYGKLIKPPDKTNNARYYLYRTYLDINCVPIVRSYIVHVVIKNRTRDSRSKFLKRCPFPRSTMFFLLLLFKFKYIFSTLF